MTPDHATELARIAAEAAKELVYSARIHMTDEQKLVSFEGILTKVITPLRQECEELKGVLAHTDDTLARMKSRAEKAEAELAKAHEDLKEASGQILDYENKEASVCPEDVGFVEYIQMLQGLLESAEKDCDDLLQLRDELKNQLQQAQAQCAAKDAVLTRMQQFFKWKENPNGEPFRLTGLAESVDDVLKSSSGQSLLTELTTVREQLEMAKVAYQQLSDNHTQKCAEHEKELEHWKEHGRKLVAELSQLRARCGELENGTYKTAGICSVDFRTAELIRRAFLPTNPNKMRNAAPEVVKAAKDFISAYESARVMEGQI